MARYLGSEIELLQLERMQSGVSWTRNDELDKNGYVVIKNFCNLEELYHPLPKERGLVTYYGSIDNFQQMPEDLQMPGALSRTNHPQYKKVHSEYRGKVEKIIGRKLRNTFYYERFYFPGIELPKHIDRPACEITCAIDISTTLKEPWSQGIKTPDVYTDRNKSAILVPGEDREIFFEPGDALIFKSCERPTWRNTMPDNKRRWFGKKEEVYLHQIFFNYVIADGERSHHAYDRSV